MASGIIPKYASGIILTASLTSVPTGVTLRNVSLKMQGNVVCGYIEVSAPSNDATVIGTISNSSLYPSATVYFPIWNVTSSEFMGYIDITTSGVVKTHPIAGLTGNKNTAAFVSYIN